MTAADTFTIREMLPSDREAVIDLIGALNASEWVISDDRSLERSDWIANLDANIEAQRMQGGVLLVTESEGAVLGFCCLLFARDEPLYIRADMRPHGRVTELVVAEAARGRGLGRRLLAEAERLCRDAGLAAMTIGVLAGNHRAERIYLDAGFRLQALELIKRL